MPQPDASYPWPWPPFSDTGYPTGRGAPEAVTGWECPGCHRCFGPSVAQCGYCGPEPVTAVAKDCGPGREGGLCSCNEPG